MVCPYVSFLYSNTPPSIDFRADLYLDRLVISISDYLFSASHYAWFCYSTKVDHVRGLSPSRSSLCCPSPSCTCQISKITRTPSDSSAHLLLLGLQERGNMVGERNGGDGIYVGLDGRTRQRRYNEWPRTNKQVGDMEDKRQVVHLCTGSRLPPTPQHPQRHPRRLLGLQDQRMMENRRYSSQKIQKNPSSVG